MNSNQFLVDKNALDYGYHTAQHAVSKIFFTIPSDRSYRSDRSYLKSVTVVVKE